VNLGERFTPEIAFVCDETVKAQHREACALSPLWSTTEGLGVATMIHKFIDQVKESLNSAQLFDVVADGGIHRFSTSDKSGDKAGWYSLHDHGDFMAGAFGDWRTDEVQTWCSFDKQDLKPAQRKAMVERIEEAQRQRAKIQQEEREAAKLEACRIWSKADDASDNHPYLIKKKVHPVGIRQAKVYGDDCLLVPLHDGETMTSLQMIKPNGEKRFLTGGEVSGCYCLIGEVKRKLYLVEGWATGATIREVTGEAVAVVFNCGNLEKVAVKLAKAYPTVLFTVCADNDHKKEVEGKGNAGLEAGRKASERINGKLVYPKDIEGTDFNDMAAEKGLDAVRNIVTAHSGKPWEGCRIPYNYACRKDGVFVLGFDKDDERLTGAPCWVSALSRDDTGSKAGNWGRLVHWFDHDGNAHDMPIPASYFHGECTDLAKMLANEGLPIIHGKEKKLVGYLSEFKPEARLLSAPSTGWNGESFVLPSETINEPAGEKMVYQPLESEAVGYAIHGKGTLEEWRGNVAGNAVSPLARFCIAAALAAPMRLHADVDAGGFHFYGTTSRGKTTILQGAASVWGNGSDPAMVGGSDVYLQRWNATKNGLEAMAAGFNDLPMCIDEIGENDGRDFGGIIYNLMSGTGKVRMSKSIGKRPVKAWRVMVLSSGELPVSEYIEANGGKVRGGQLIRLVDVPAVDLFTNEQEADTMKRACRDYYGTAGAAFLARESIVQRFVSAWRAFDYAQVGTTTTPEAGRALRRFCLVACVGELAIDAQVLPWVKGDAIKAARHAFELWQGSSSSKTEGERGTDAIKDFILKHDARFERENAKANPIPHERAGWFKMAGSEGGFYHFLPNVFDEQCGGVNSKTVKQELKARGWLKVEAEGRLNNNFYSAEAKRTIRVVSVSDELLES
jgi:putative DNA primase/helicase